MKIHNRRILITNTNYYWKIIQKLWNNLKKRIWNYFDIKYINSNLIIKYK